MQACIGEFVGGRRGGSSIERRLPREKGDDEAVEGTPKCIDGGVEIPGAIPARSGSAEESG